MRRRRASDAFTAPRTAARSCCRSDRLDERSAKGLPPIFELGWNHTTLRALRVDPAITYLQVLYPLSRTSSTWSSRSTRDFGDEVLAHLEFVRFDGKVDCFGLPLVRFTTEERLDEIIAHPRGRWARRSSTRIATRWRKAA